jgi:hypothetical protein
MKASENNILRFNIVLEPYCMIPSEIVPWHFEGRGDENKTITCFIKHRLH